jgi:hypothetical protein
MQPEIIFISASFKIKSLRFYAEAELIDGIFIIRIAASEPRFDGIFIIRIAASEPLVFYDYA